MMLRAVNALLDALVDYAGLFPPSALDMPAAAANYARYRSGEHAFALARFVAPAARLGELEAAWRPHRDAEPLRVSALVTDVERDLPLIEAFNERGAGIVDAVEVKAATVQAITALRTALPHTLAVYFELPPGEGIAALVSAVRDSGGRAKIRTGGVTSDAFPAASDIVHFMAACARTATPFKATAGLHHPLRCVRPLTYEPDSVTGTMHGFANVFLAATLLREGENEKTCVALLEDDDTAHFNATDDAILWRDRAIGSESIAETRRDIAVSFGSCSFEEPIADLQALGWL